MVIQFIRRCATTMMNMMIGYVCIYTVIVIITATTTTTTTTTTDNNDNDIAQ